MAEVAESSLRYDRLVKAPLYAEAGVTEYWLLDTTRRLVEVYASPRQGVYRKVSKASKGALPVPGVTGVSVELTALFD